MASSLVADSSASAFVHACFTTVELLFIEHLSPPQWVNTKVWMASSLMADSLAVAGQALVAKSLGGGDALTTTGREHAVMVAQRVSQLALLLGLVLAALLGLFRHAIARLFTRDPMVLLILSGERRGCSI